MSEIDRLSASPMTRPSIVADGRKVGPYELRYELASGGMATVYLARAPGVGRMPARAVALKCIHPHLARRADLAAMFVDEARIAARIQHPHVCTVIDAGESDGTSYLAMEFLRGESLASVQRALTGEQPPIEALVARVTRIVADACEGLHAAHELRDDAGLPLGVIHRDVTPGNLFLGYDGLVRVVDFGIARAEGRTQRTATGDLKGTIAYMAPEQIAEQRIDRRVDVWAIGVVAWELLTGRRLFRRATDLETLRAVPQAPIEPPSRIRPGIPAAIDRAVLGALERDPEARWATARELGLALHHATATVGGAAHPAELAVWLEQVAPGRREEKDALVAATLAERTAGDRGERLTAPAIVLPAPVREDATAPARIRSESVREPTWRERRPPRRRHAVLGGIAITLGVAIAAVVAWPSPATSPHRPAASPPEPQLSARPSRPPPVATPVEAPEPPPIPPVEFAETAPAEPEDARARSRRAGGAGHASVSVRGGWADIYHRGRFVGRTPLRVELPAGRQVLELRPFGEGPSRTLVVRVIPEGETSASIAVR